MKRAATVLALAAAVLGLLTGKAAAQACPTLRVTTRAPRVVRNNKLISVAISAKNVGTTPATTVTIGVRRPGLISKQMERNGRVDGRTDGRTDRGGGAIRSIHST